MKTRNKILLLLIVLCAASSVFNHPDNAAQENAQELYETWLEGYIEKGGVPTHSYDCHFEVDEGEFRVLQPGETISRTLGSEFTVFIVPDGTNVDLTPLRRSEILYMENFSVNNRDFVPIYSDMESPNEKVEAILEEWQEKAREERKRYGRH